MCLVNPKLSFEDNILESLLSGKNINKFSLTLILTLKIYFNELFTLDKILHYLSKAQIIDNTNKHRYTRYI